MLKEKFLLFFKRPLISYLSVHIAFFGCLFFFAKLIGCESVSDKAEQNPILKDTARVNNAILLIDSLFTNPRFKDAFSIYDSMQEVKYYHYMDSLQEDAESSYSIEDSYR